MTKMNPVDQVMEVKARRIELLFKQEYKVITPEELLELDALNTAHQKRKTSKIDKKMSFGK